MGEQIHHPAPPRPPVDEMDEFQPAPMEVRGDVSSAVAQEIVHREQERVRVAREAILALPTHDEGLDMDRVRAFRENLGAPAVPILVLRPGEYEAAIALAGSSPDTENGRHLIAHGLVLVRRDPDLEVMNGPGFIEGLAAHEIAHADSGNDRVLLSASVRRRGFRKLQASVGVAELGGFTQNDDEGNDLGSGLEEAYAELQRGRFVTEHLGRKLGFGGAGSMGKVDFAEKYSVLLRGEQGVTATIPDGAFLAPLLEVLIKRDPRIEEALKQARYSEHGAVQLEELLDAQKPGLHNDLMASKVGTLEEREQAAHMFADTIAFWRKQGTHGA